jgi:hypothetical protein
MKSPHQAVFLSVFSFVKRTLPTCQHISTHVSTRASTHSTQSVRERVVLSHVYW